MKSPLPMNKRQTDIAFSLAKQFHKNQFRRDGITPYFNHVQDVARVAGDRFGFDDELIAVALAHDLLEDTKLTKFDLLNSGLSETVVDAVIALTHLHENESYDTAILRARANALARKVKIADNLANLADKPTDKQILKYTKSLQKLLSNE